MKPVSLLRYVLLPAAMLAAGVKAGIWYAKSVYISKDRKFIEGDVVKSEE